MKALKTIGILLILLIVLGLIASLILPKEITIEKDVTIKASPDVVWNYISKHETFDQWSPWNKLDSNMTKEIVGEDGTVGAKWVWKSDKRKVGNGEQEFTVLNQDSGMVETKLTFDGRGEAKSWRNMTDNGDRTVTVKWGFNTKTGIPGNLFMLLMGMEKEMEKQFSSGLDDLKTLCEEHVEEEPAPEKPETEFDVQEGTFSSTNYLGKRQIVKWADMKSHYETHLPTMAGLAKDKVAGVPSSLYWEWDVENQQADMTAAMPVSTDEAMGDYDNIAVDSSRSLTIDYFGNYEGIAAAHEWLGYYMAINKMEMNNLVIEQYMNDPQEVQDTSKWHTRIVYLVK